MKTLRGYVICLVVLGALGATLWFVPALHVRAIVWGLNSGIIPIEKADWGYLRLRSGQTGLTALAELERHGTNEDIRRTAAAVQLYYVAKGVDPIPYPHDYVMVADHETRFDELRLPLDGKTLRQELPPGQRIPDSFWQAQRYRLPCLLPPKTLAAGECILHMTDLTGDNLQEVIVDRHAVGTWEEYKKQAVDHRLAVFQSNGSDWHIVARMHLCRTDQAAASDGHVTFPRRDLDMLWVNGHAVNLFDSDCFARENTVSAPAPNLDQARAMAPLLTQIPRLSSSKPIPASLAVAVYEGAIALPWATEPPMGATWARTAYQGLPPCFTKHNPKACSVMVTDIDHDGSDDVIIFDHELRHDISAWRLATLLMKRKGRWTVVASHAACAEEGQNLDDAKVELKAAAWRPIEFAGRLYLPDEPSDSCKQHYLSM